MSKIPLLSPDSTTSAGGGQAKEVIQMARIPDYDEQEDRGDYWYKWFNRAAWIIGFETGTIISLILAIVLH